MAQSVRKMRLVPESYYENIILKNLKSQIEPEARLEKRQKSILDKKIPDDLKLLLYNQFARNLVTKRTRRRKKPILVEQEKSNEKQPITYELPEYISSIQSPKAADLYRILKAYGITNTVNDQVIINDRIIPTSNMRNLLQALTDAKYGYTAGLSETLNVLPKKLAEGFIPKLVLKHRTGAGHEWISF